MSLLQNHLFLYLHFSRGSSVQLYSSFVCGQTVEQTDNYMVFLQCTVAQIPISVIFVKNVNEGLNKTKKHSVCLFLKIQFLDILAEFFSSVCCRKAQVIFYIYANHFFNTFLNQIPRRHAT